MRSVPAGAFVSYSSGESEKARNSPNRPRNASRTNPAAPFRAVELFMPNDFTAMLERHIGYCADVTGANGKDAPGTMLQNLHEAIA